MITIDNPWEFALRMLKGRSYMGVKLDTNLPGPLMENSVIESFNG